MMTPTVLLLQSLSYYATPYNSSFITVVDM
jgi:hypothetical protein